MLIIAMLIAALTTGFAQTLVDVPSLSRVVPSTCEDRLAGPIAELSAADLRMGRHGCFEIDPDLPAVDTILREGKLATPALMAGLQRPKSAIPCHLLLLRIWQPEGYAETDTLMCGVDACDGYVYRALGLSWLEADHAAGRILVKLDATEWAAAIAAWKSLVPKYELNLSLTSATSRVIGEQASDLPKGMHLGSRALGEGVLSTRSELSLTGFVKSKVRDPSALSYAVAVWIPTARTARTVLRFR